MRRIKIMTSTTEPLIKRDTVPTSQVQIVISSPRNRSHETDTVNCTNNEVLQTTTTVDEQSQSAQNSAANEFANHWHRRNSISLPAGLDTIMSEPPEYEPQVNSFIFNTYVTLPYMPRKVIFMFYVRPE